MSIIFLTLLIVFIESTQALTSVPKGDHYTVGGGSYAAESWNYDYTQAAGNCPNPCSVG